MTVLAMLAAGPAGAASENRLLTDPILLDPSHDGVAVVWFTEFEGRGHAVELFEGETTRAVPARSARLSRMVEDEGSHVGAQAGDGSRFAAPAGRAIFRHEAMVSGLEAGRTLPYRVVSMDDEGARLESARFELQPLPPAGQPLKLLVTSDHQLKPMVPANLEMVERTIGRIDAVLFPGDLVNVPDRASEWFDDARGLGFFPTLQGRTDFALETEDGGSRRYRGGALLQRTPIYPVIGNHEVMGRFDPARGLNAQYNDPQPRAVAQGALEDSGADPAARAAAIRDRSFNWTSFAEIFGFPEFKEGDGYYFRRFGDVALVGLNVTRIYRRPAIDGQTRGKYAERDADLERPEAWGWGTFPFVTIESGSEQHAWLENVLQSEAFASAPFRIVMLHHPPAGYGGNVVPPFTVPEQIIERDATGATRAIRYEYPLERDMLVHDLEPLLVRHGVQLVLFGHSHLWQRIALESGLHYLESSNVGNSYGCHIEGGQPRGNVPDDPRFDPAGYARFGDPRGLPLAPPSIFAPQADAAGNPLPCVASNSLTVFSVIDTGAGAVQSYVFDTARPDEGVRMFDSFPLR